VLYLVQPHGHLQWVDVPAGAIELARQRDVDLARLPWNPSQERDSGIVLELALRHGAACSLGLVIDAHHVAEHAHAAESALDEARTALGRHNEFMEHRLDDYMEHLFPDWPEQRTRLEGDDAGAASAGDEQGGLDTPVDPALARSWVELGGQLP
jgi:hypothetical protein